MGRVYDSSVLGPLGYYIKAGVLLAPNTGTEPTIQTTGRDEGDDAVIHVTANARAAGLQTAQYGRTGNTKKPSDQEPGGGLGRGHGQIRRPHCPEPLALGVLSLLCTLPEQLSADCMAKRAPSTRVSPRLQDHSVPRPKKSKCKAPHFTDLYIKAALRGTWCHLWPGMLWDKSCSSAREMNKMRHDLKGSRCLISTLWADPHPVRVRADQTGLQLFQSLEQNHVLPLTSWHLYMNQAPWSSRSQ